MTTPTTPDGLRRYDNLPPAEAVLAAWTQPGPNAAWHQSCRAAVAEAMPVLARALNRLEQDSDHLRRR